MHNSRLSILLTGIILSGCLFVYGQTILNEKSTTESLSSTQKNIQSQHTLGEITSTGLTIGNTNYSLRIQSINEDFLLAMPQLTVDDSIQYFMPNKLVESKQQFDPTDLQTQSLPRKLKPEDFRISND